MGIVVGIAGVSRAGKSTLIELTKNGNESFKEDLINYIWTLAKRELVPDLL